jgi:DMSO/TMAO reductase YedYZ molybdopterin-dependent catalytic subunit
MRALIAAQPPLPGGRLVGTLPLGSSTPRQTPPLDRLVGAGLDARLFADLSSLSYETPTLPADRFFVRTAAPRSLAQGGGVRLGGLVNREATVDDAALSALTEGVGEVLLECAGNTDPTNFGLIGTARWDGVPIGAVLDRVEPRRGATRILVRGVDDPGPARTSVPGASWIFTRDQLEKAGAFLATRMNGAPLPRHHGAPARLIVPGWYGCACIKWVDRIDVVADDAPATSQMVEFAARTHQEGEPSLARDFAPATIDTAAMPVRVEQWRVDDRLVYRVVGIVWGGTKPTSALQIRFQAREPFVAVTDCPQPSTTRTWSLWSHVWTPVERRRYDIVLRIADPVIRSRRLDLFFYARSVVVNEI